MQYVDISNKKIRNEQNFDLTKESYFMWFSFIFNIHQEDIAKK